MTRLRLALATLAAALALAAGSAVAATPGFGNLYYNGSIVRTVVPPAAFPNGGVDTFYKIDNGVAGQLGVAGSAPGAPGYDGGHWAVSHAAFNAGVTPYLLTSASAVTTAQSAGDVTITRTPSQDFLCPVQP